MTGAEIYSDVRNILGMQDNATDNAYIALWAEQTVFGEMLKYNWPELITENDSFTTDGATTYDLTAEIDSTFLRVVSGTVRSGTERLKDASKKSIVVTDPDFSDTGTLSHYYLGGRKRFTLYPFGSSGDIVYMDWVGMPTMFDEDTTEANMPFDPDRHYLIHEGILWRGMRRGAKPDWLNDTIAIYRKEMREKFASCKPINRTHIDPKPINF